MTESSQDIATTLEAARELFRVPLPRADARWPRLKPHLLAAEARLTRQLRDNPEDDLAGVQLQEVRRYLGRHA